MYSRQKQHIRARATRANSKRRAESVESVERARLYLRGRPRAIEQATTSYLTSFLSDSTYIYAHAQAPRGLPENLTMQREKERERWSKISSVSETKVAGPSTRVWTFPTFLSLSLLFLFLSPAREISIRKNGSVFRAHLNGGGKRGG